MQIHQYRAGSVGFIHGILPRQPVAHVILGQQDVPHSGIYLRFILLHPQDFRRSKAGQSIIAGDLDQALLAQAGSHLVALRTSALVVP